MNYHDYLKSEAWAVRRQWALELAGHRCALCNASERLDVHHKTYERIGIEPPSDLTVLCRACHQKFHGKGGPAEPTYVADKDVWYAEREILAALFARPEFFGDVRHLLRPEDFRSSDHASLFTAMLRTVDGDQGAHLDDAILKELMHVSAIATPHLLENAMRTMRAGRPEPEPGKDAA